MTRGEALAELARRWGGCQQCPLHAQRTNIVFGKGNPGASILVISEAPGANEDEQGAPFVGAAGDLLHGTLTELVPIPEDHLYFTNVVMCRPPKNRNPSRAELAACRKRLETQIKIVDPLLITTLGKVATNAILGRAAATSIRNVLGEVCMAPFQGVAQAHYRPVIPNWHPAFLLHSALQTPQGELRIDGVAAREFVGIWQKVHAVWSRLMREYFGGPAPTRR